MEVSTRATKLSQFCHGCGRCVKNPLAQRWHQCACGIGPVQRDLYAAFLASTLSADQLIPSCAQTVVPWEGAEARLPQSRSQPTPEPAFLARRGRLEAWKDRSEPPVL